MVRCYYDFHFLLFVGWVHLDFWGRVMAPAWQRHNNPFDVSIPINGQTFGGYKAGVVGQGDYAHFPTMQVGYQAGEYRIKDYIERKRWNTIRVMGSHYATAHEWPSSVSKYSGIGQDTILVTSNKAQMDNLCYGILAVEIGSKTIAHSLMSQHGGGSPPVLKKPPTHQTGTAGAGGALITIGSLLQFFQQTTPGQAIVWLISGVVVLLTCLFIRDRKAPDAPALTDVNLTDEEKLEDLLAAQEHILSQVPDLVNRVATKADTLNNLVTRANTIAKLIHIPPNGGMTEATNQPASN
jgi:hypothetical protein